MSDDQRDRAAIARERVMRTLREAAEARRNPVERLEMQPKAEEDALRDAGFRGERK